MSSFLPSILSGVLLLLARAAAAQPAPPMADKDVFEPMAVEMRRSLERLREEKFGPPYFLAYRLTDERHYDVSGAYGSILQDGEDSYATLFVEARFGGRTLDNTDLGFQGWHGPAGRTPDVLRHSLWSLTDAAYKNALTSYLEKKARLATELVPEPLDDFTVEPSTSFARPSAPAAFDRAAARLIVEKIGAVFRKYPFVYDARVSLNFKWSRRYLLTSEGTRVASDEENVPSELVLSAMSRAPDGMRLESQRNWPFRTLADLPTLAVLEKEADEMARELDEERAAPAQAPAAAPAILDPEFTGVLFHEALGHKLEGQRQRDPQQSQVFRDLVGRRVIPPFLSLVDDPTLGSYQGVPLHGHYDFDAEGVPAQKVTLVDRGVLKGFLMSRWPLKGFSRSNGHGRADASSRPTGRMATLIVRAEAPVSRDELEKRLLERLRKSGKPYGFLLVGASGGENPNSREAAQTLEVRPHLIYRVDAKTGKRTLVRGASVVGTPLVLLNRIEAAADDAVLANGFICGAESGYVPVDQIAPSVLVSEVELQRLPEDRARPPILPSPFHEY